MTTRTKLIRRAFGAAVIATSSLLMMAAPAHAATIYKIHPEWVDGCPGCPMAVNFKFTLQAPDETPVEPERVADKIAVATELLLRYAETVPDLDWPKNPFASRGIAEYTAAANLAGNGSFAVDDDEQCGNGKPKPIPHGPYADAEQLMADGLTTLGQSAVERDADAAAALQDRAAGELVKAAVLLSSGG
jgi:hypothetical protein